jgi:hypothetical protein
MLWSYKLSEVDFVIEHKAGSKIGHVDALSRHAGAVIDGGSLDKEIMLHKQAKYEFYIQKKYGVYSSRQFF